MSFLRIYSFSRLSYLFALILVLPLVGCSGGDGGVAALSWIAPSEREDNTALSLSEIAGFRIYYGTESGSYQDNFDVNDGSATQAQLLGVPAGTYYVVVTTIDADGRESLFSEEVVVTL